MRKLTGIATLAACLLGWSGPSPDKASAAGSYTAKVYADSLTVRSEPAKDAAVKGSVKNGSLVTVSDEQHGWMKVQAGKTSGWVAGYYLKKVSGSAQASPATATTTTKATTTAATVKTSGGTKVSVAADSLRIRSGPGTGYEVLGSLRAGDSVTPLARENGWVRISTAGGQQGWVAGQYLSSSGTSAVQTVSAAVPAASTGSLRGKLIVVDPGHGGSDPGMIGTTYNTMEKDLNLQTALYVRDYLRDAGARVELTRTSDQKPTLSRRAGLSAALGADAFVSIHYNSSPKKVSGTLTFYYSEADDLRLARALETRLGQGIGLKSNGISFGDYHILRNNGAPAALVELGFLSNPTDESTVRTSSYQKKAARAIANGMADYFRR
ncbi:cell wall hydrolase [Paenibacillus donghaensis]|uniref:Cell wall hydrolase n=2 Tax=Paenibacillus donghaensis TaxID=414771 RepID=A0A2Z2KTH4_9BACL|nr:cell wall hydrolase [Paenibacillus donghaensis]